MHFYNEKGEPQFEIIGKNGKLRRPTIKDARENNWVPSTTTVLSLLDKPLLDQWIQYECVRAALEAEKKADESREEFVDRIIEDAQEKSRKAKDFGTKIHNEIENYLKFGNLREDMIDDRVREYMQGVLVWINENRLEVEAEHTVVNKDFAGTIDAFGLINGEDAIIDFKTQSTKPDTKMNFYPEWSYQLAAYGILLNKFDVDFYNVAISSTEPKRIEVKKWDKEEINKGKIIFEHCLSLFKLIKNI